MITRGRAPCEKFPMTCQKRRTTGGPAREQKKAFREAEDENRGEKRGNCTALARKNEACGRKLTARRG